MNAVLMMKTPFPLLHNLYSLFIIYNLLESFLVVITRNILAAGRFLSYRWFLIAFQRHIVFRFLSNFHWRRLKHKRLRAVYR